MKIQFFKICASLILVLYSLQLSLAQCTPDTLAWHVNETVTTPYNSISSTVFSINKVSNVYFMQPNAAWTFLPSSVGIEISDPSSRLFDSNTYNTNPFDPQGGCAPYAGSADPDNVPGDGSIEDPWDSDCDPQFTQTNGALGTNCLTLGMTALDHTEEVTVTFSFEVPVVLTGMKISAIDAIGLKYASANSLDPKEEPGSSYQDEVIFSATSGCGASVPITYAAGSDVSLYGDTVRANYDINSNNELLATDPNGAVTISTTDAITELTITYSNGIDDANAEQNNPNDYSWWSATNGATNGVSDGMTICLDSMFYCICPSFSIFTANTNPDQPDFPFGVPYGCNGTEILYDLTGRDGTAPYSFQAICLADGTSTTLTNSTDSTAQFQTFLDDDKVYKFFATDANCCIAEVSLYFEVDYCYDVSVEKIIDGESAAVGDTIPFKVILHNEGPDTVHSIEVTDYFPPGMLYGGSYTATEGTFDGTIWSVDSLVQNESDTLFASLVVTAMGTLTNEVEVTSMEERDFDSTPGNFVYAEDDIANDCITVPVQICEGKTIDIDITAPSGYYTYQWYKDGTVIPSATNSTYTITSVGAYHYTTGGHPDGQCAGILDCPIVVRYKECCTQPICQPVTTTTN